MVQDPLGLEMLCLLRRYTFWPLCSGHSFQLQINFLDFYRMQDSEKETASKDRRRSREDLVFGKPLEIQMWFCEDNVEFDRLGFCIRHFG